MKANFLDHDTVLYWANRYPVSAEGDTEAIGYAENARYWGYLTPEDLEILARWKTPRILPLIKRNTWKSIYFCSLDAFRAAEHDDILDALRKLKHLSGVGLPMGTSILHLAGYQCPIIDYRALWSLDIPHSNVSWAGLKELMKAFRTIQNETHLDARTIDRSLWQYSRENQPVTEDILRKNGKKGKVA